MYSSGPLTTEELAKKTVNDVFKTAATKLAVEFTNQPPCKCKIEYDRLRPITIKVLQKSEKAIVKLIENVWKITNVMQYTLKHVKTNNDDCSIYYWFEALFSKPTLKYPVPQVTCRVIFRAEHSLIHGAHHPIEVKYRVEGFSDWHKAKNEDFSIITIVTVMREKAKLFKHIEDLAMF